LLLSRTKRCSRPIRPVLEAAWLFLLVGMVPAAQAGAPEVNCSKPFVFANAGVNAVVLPYTYSGAPDRPLDAAGKELSSLIYLNTLFSILKFESVGAVQLVARNPVDSKECTDLIVLDKLLGKRPGATTQILPGGGLVMLWGRIYEEDGNIYVQSYLRFLRRGVNEEVNFQTGEEKFNAVLASQVITFAPRKLSSADLFLIEREFESSEGFRNKPDPQEPSRAIHFDFLRYHSPFAYRIVEVRGEWIRVEPFTPFTPGGWVRAGFGADRWPLRDKMPELSFVEGLVGYLTYRRGEASNPGHIAASTPEKIAGSFQRYETASETQPSALPKAVERQILGILKSLRRETSQGDAVAASAFFKEAYDLIPESGEARNLMACADLWAEWSAATEKWPNESNIEKISEDFVGAVALDPRNDRVLGNLQSFYDLALRLRGPQDSLSIQLAKRRTAVIRLRRANGIAPKPPA